jgi:hypothetical protein
MVGDHLLRQVDSPLPCDDDVLRGATIREVSQAVFSSGSAWSTRRLYKSTVQRSVSQEELEEVRQQAGSLKKGSGLVSSRKVAV